MGLSRVIDARSEDPFEVLRARQLAYDTTIGPVVAQIIEDVRLRGDEALLESARQFDARDLKTITVSAEELGSAEVADHELQALLRAAHRIEQFHVLQMSHVTKGLTRHGASFGWAHKGVGQRILALSSVGVYVPGGRAVYPSSVLMNGLPAQVAGVEHRFVTTPARSDGTLAPAVLVALKLAGIEKVFKVGGAAAVAALAFGTESVPRVDKIVGPGNRYVNEAKRQLWGRVGLDGYAGPSEVCVLVDKTANPVFAAADLLTQIEHSDDNAAFLVSTDSETLSQVLEEAERKLTGVPNEASMRRALATESFAIVAKDLSQAVDIVNAIAPEHLTILTKDPERVVDGIKNAGCILLGEFTPQSAADYVLGPSHTLPTHGAARFASPVNVLDFVKIQSIAGLSEEQLEDLTPVIEALGAMESFPVHARGATIRRPSGGD